MNWVYYLKKKTDPSESFPAWSKKLKLAKREN
jgi:hypothetical protein